MAKGSCTLVESESDFPPKYQYYSNPKLGGRIMLADYCPYMISYSDGDCRYNEPKQDLLVEEYGSSSRCFQSRVTSRYLFISSIIRVYVTFYKSDPGVQLSGNDMLLGCYRAACVSSTELKVLIGKVWYDCKEDDEIVDVVGEQKGYFKYIVLFSSK
jgi:hypothetical protein